MKQKNLYFYTNLLAWGLVLLLIGNYVFGWTTPTATPPSSNLPAPINAGPDSQTKAGNLTIEGNLTTGSFKMAAEADAGKVLTTDASGIASWQTATAGATPAGSTGHIQFNDAGALGADSNLFWDNTNKRLGIGTTTPGSLLDINGALGVKGALTLTPSGVPTAAKGVIYYDQSTDTFKGYQGSGWVNIYTGSQTGYTISTVQGTTADTLAKNAANTILISPIFIPFIINVNSFLLQVTTALGATGDVGLYNSNGQLLLNGGSGTLTTTTGLKSVAPVQTGSARLTPPGQYYLAITWNSTTGVIAGVNVSGLIPRSGTITGGGLVLPSSITLSGITATNYIYAVTLSGSDQKENGAICSVVGDCLSGYCYIDNDGDRAPGTTGALLCRSQSPIAADCNDNCSTCYPGSPTYTLSADGLDQDCDGVNDNTVVYYTTRYSTDPGAANQCILTCTAYNSLCYGMWLHPPCEGPWVYYSYCTATVTCWEYRQCNCGILRYF